VKERPILFQGAMVRALLAGTKTQTRRAIRLQTGRTFDEHALVAAIQEWRPVFDKVAGCNVGERAALIRCPYGQPGDRLWVRERGWIARSGLAFLPYVGNEENKGPTSPDGTPYKPCPSIHMPRWASRILLEITGVRVERLQAISEADAMTEGARCFNDIPRGPLSHPMAHLCRWSMESPTSTDQCLSTPQMAFANYINKVNGDGTWETNPWVWVVEFKRAEEA
jgi:hypothetical protein